MNIHNGDPISEDNGLDVRAIRNNLKNSALDEIPTLLETAYKIFARSFLLALGSSDVEKYTI